LVGVDSCFALPARYLIFASFILMRQSILTYYPLVLSEVRELCRSLLAGSQHVSTLDAVRGKSGGEGGLKPQV